MGGAGMQSDDRKSLKDYCVMVEQFLTKIHR